MMKNRTGRKGLSVMLTIFTYILFAACTQASTKGGLGTDLIKSGSISQPGNEPVRPVKLKAPAGRAIAAFSEGCFWHSEIIFESLKGVDSVVSGYAGGKSVNPGYEDVSSGSTGHAETALVYYDPSKLTYSQLVHAFFLSHDPTQLDRQNNDVGSQYRSIAFFQTPQEKTELLASISQAQKQLQGKKIVTQVLPLKTFYRAEGYHQNYIAQHPDEPYVRNVCIPEYHDFRKVYKGALKPQRF